MRVRVDPERCVGDGACVTVCPEIFEMDGDVAKTKMTEVPPGLDVSCREAADECVTEAIIIED